MEVVGYLCVLTLTNLACSLFLQISDFSLQIYFHSLLNSIEKKANRHFWWFSISFRWSTHLSARNHWNNILRPHTTPEFRKLKLHQFQLFAKIKLARERSKRLRDQRPFQVASLDWSNATNVSKTTSNRWFDYSWPFIPLLAHSSTI